MPFIPFPNVPFVPGVPLIPRSPLVPPQAQIALGLIQAMIWQVYQNQTRWGIYSENGSPIFNVNSFQLLEIIGAPTLSTNSVDYSKETKVSDFPLEQGGFAAYNKVETPASPIVTLAFSGSEQDRSAFINAIDAACLSTDLFSVVTPEKTYINYSINRYNYQRRNTRGANYYIVEIGLTEIRQVSAQFSQSTPINDPQSPSAVPPVDAGKVQPVEQSTANKIFKGLFNSVTP